MSLNTGNAILSNGITLDSSYNVGIGGAASGSYKLQVTGTTNLTGALTGTTGTFGSSLIVGSTSILYGNVAIKSNSATSYFGLNVIANGNNNFIAVNHTGTAGVIETEYSTGGGYTPLSFVVSGTERMKINTNGSTAFVYRNGSGEVMDLLLSTETAESKSKLSLMWYGNETASIKFKRGGDATGGSLEFWTQAETQAIAQRMTILANGNVGIGTSSPSYKLDIRNDVAASTSLDPISLGLYNGNDGGSAIYFRNSVGGQSKISFGVDAPGSGTDDTYLAFSTGSNTSLVERMRITSGGNLYYNSSTTPYNARVFIVTDIGGENGLLMKTGTDSGSYGYLRFVNAANQQIGGIFQATSTTLNYATSSDYRLKEDLKDFNGLDKISAIKVYDFKWKDSNQRMEGVMAHELQEVVPYAVNGEKDALEEDGTIRTQSVDYSKLVPVLVKAIQEMNQTIQNQQQQINSLINR